MALAEDLGIFIFQRQARIFRPGFDVIDFPAHRIRMNQHERDLSLLTSIENPAPDRVREMTERERLVRQVFVLGDPAYYRRFGFLPERQVLTPFPIPEHLADAWQSMLPAGGKRMAAGRLSVLEPWMEPALWAP